MAWSDKQFRGIYYRDQAEDIGGPVYRFSPDNSSAQRLIHIQYSDLEAATRAFLGYSTVSGGAIDRVTPHYLDGIFKYDSSGNRTEEPWFWCVGASRVDGLAVHRADAATGVPYGSLCRMQLLYSPLHHRVLEDDDADMVFSPATGQDSPMGVGHDEASLARYVSRHYSPFVKGITIPQALLKWVLEPGDTGYTGSAPGPPILESANRIEGGIVIELTHHSRPDLPVNTIQAALGRVNAYPFDGFGAESLLCDAPVIKAYPSGAFQFVYDITFRFKYLPKVDSSGLLSGHNAFLRYTPRDDGTKALDYRWLTTDGLETGDYVYDTFDFSRLLRPE